MKDSKENPDLVPAADETPPQDSVAQPEQPQKATMNKYNRIGLGIFLTFFVLLLVVNFTLSFFPSNLQVIIYYFRSYIFIRPGIYLFALPILFFANVFIISYLNAFASRANETGNGVGIPNSAAVPSSIASPSIDRRDAKSGVALVLAYVVLIFTSYWIIYYILSMNIRIVFSISSFWGEAPKLKFQLETAALVLGGVIVIAGLTFLFAWLGRKYALKSSNRTNNPKGILIYGIAGIIVVYIALQAAALITSNAEMIKEEKLQKPSNDQVIFCDRFDEINIITGDSEIGELSGDMVTGEINTKKDWDAHIIKVQALVDAAPEELRDESNAYLRMVKAQAELRAKYGYIDPYEYPAGVYDKFQIERDQDTQQSEKFYDGATAYCAKDLGPEYDEKTGKIKP